MYCPLRWPPPDVSTSGGGIGPQVDKFEQVPGLMWEGRYPGGGYSEGKSGKVSQGVGYVTYPMMHVMYLPQTDRLLQQLRLRAVIKSLLGCFFYDLTNISHTE